MCQMSQNWRSSRVREGEPFGGSASKLSTQRNFFIYLVVMSLTPIYLLQDKRDSDLSRSKLQIFGDGHLCSSLPAPTQSDFCKPRFVFHTGSGFSQPSSWEHDSILCIKAKIQLKLRIREQSKEQLTLPWRGCYRTRQFLQMFSSHCCPKRRRDAPGACLCSYLSLVLFKTPGSAHKVCLSSSGAWSRDYGVSPSSLCITPHLLSLKTGGTGSCVPIRQPSSDEPGWPAFLQLVQILMPCSLLSSRKRKQTFWSIIHLNGFMERLGNYDSMKLIQVK